MPLSFTKMHGLGNDYLLISLFDQVVEDPVALAQAMCDRHRGAGADGLILVGPPESSDADLRMEILNPDGSWAEMCGNGVRCLAKLAYDRGLVRSAGMAVQTDAGILGVDLSVAADGQVSEVRVDMGEPRLEPRRIPVSLAGERVVAHPLQVEGDTLSLTCVSMGNPHAVLFEHDLGRVPLKEWGPQIGRHPMFPNGTNVHFVQVIRPDLVGMITWERGAGITQACGTGASAVCVAGVLNKVTDRTITVRVPGGRLRIRWDEETNHVLMSGPAVEVFTGRWPG
jgi:diaminopimelate epimerase